MTEMFERLVQGLYEGHEELHGVLLLPHVDRLASHPEVLPKPL